MEKSDKSSSFVASNIHHHKERGTPLWIEPKSEVDGSIRGIADFFSSKGEKDSQDFISVASISSDISTVHELTNKQSTFSRRVHFSVSGGEGRYRCGEDGCALRVEVIPVMALRHHREKSKIWYNQREFASMQDENSIVVKLMEMGYNDETLVQNTASCLRGTSNDSIVMTTRGLERQTKKGFSCYLNARASSLQAVLTIQKLEKDSEPSIRAERIAFKYRLEASKAIKASLERASTDAILSRKYLYSGGCDIVSVHRLQALENASPKTSSLSNLKLFRRRRGRSVDIY